MNQPAFKLTPRRYEKEDTIFIYMGCVALGDIINTIPTIDFILKQYAKYKVDVITTYPELFQSNPRLNTVIKDDYDKKRQNDLHRQYKFRFSLFPPMCRATVFHAASHCIDFVSVNAIQRILPKENKVINIQGSITDKKNAENLLQAHKIDPEKAVLLHPARSWPSRTLPSKTWQEVVNGILDEGFQPVVFGKDLPSPINDPVDDKSMIHLDNVISLTNKTSVLETIELLRLCKYLITMDTAPVHLAASTDINIIGIFTIIHPEYRLPYRIDPKTKKVSQEYNTWVVPNTQPCAYCAEKTFEAMPINVCTFNTYACMPSSKMILDTWKKSIR